MYERKNRREIETPVFAEATTGTIDPRFALVEEIYGIKEGKIPEAFLSVYDVDAYVRCGSIDKLPPELMIDKDIIKTLMRESINVPTASYSKYNGEGVVTQMLLRTNVDVIIDATLRANHIQYIYVAINTLCDKRGIKLDSENMSRPVYLRCIELWNTILTSNLLPTVATVKN